MKKTIQRRPLPAITHPVSHSPVLARLFAARGVERAEELDYQLQYLLKPDTLKGLDQALTLLVDALTHGESILILGDFDADGATSTALAVRCLRALGCAEVNFLVPNRFEYGYGLTPEIVEVAAQYAPQLLITVDNGISSLEGVARAQALGIKVLVTDHHLPGAQLPSAEAIVNPNQPGCDFPCKALAGVGVIFYVLSALRTRLRTLGWFAQRPEPNFAEYLDIVALGTVADVVPLEHNNRLLVAQGLKRIQAGRCCEGIKALLQVASRAADTITATDLGFVVGPRLNAAGRLDDMSLGIQCLLTDNPAEALALAQELDALNRDRRAIETGMQQEALVLLATLERELAGQLPTGLCLFHADWHQGVIGILASRIKDRLHRPVIVFALDEQGQLKASGRSIPGFHLRDALDEVASAHPHMLKKFGGHAMAAGLSLAPEYLAAFKIAFDAVAHKHLGTSGLEAKMFTDGELLPAEFNLTLAADLAAAGPWGQAFPEPCFDGEFNLVQQRLLGGKHLKMVLSPRQAPHQLIDAIAFNIDVKAWPNTECRHIRLVYKLAANEFRGQTSLQLMVDYMEPLGA